MHFQISTAQNVQTKAEVQLKAAPGQCVEQHSGLRQRSGRQGDHAVRGRPSGELLRLRPWVSKPRGQVQQGVPERGA